MPSMLEVPMEVTFSKIGSMLATIELATFSGSTSSGSFSSATIP